MTVFRIIDCETTGMEDDSKVVEVGSLDLVVSDGARSLGNPQSHLINPGVPIPAVASAVHHITDDMVKDAPKIGEVHELYLGADVYVAHNSRFDQKYLGTLGKPWIDTYRCALIAWPDAPGHSNQVLRYHLGLESPPDGYAHRALYDVYVTARLFIALLGVMSVEQMLTASNEPALLPIIRFGKHRGMKFTDAPVDYLRWMDGQDFDEDIKHTVKTELKRRSS